MFRPMKSESGGRPPNDDLLLSAILLIGVGMPRLFFLLQN